MDTKTIDFGKTVYDLCSVDSDLANILSDIGFKDITKPGMLNTAGRFMTITKGAAMKKMNIDLIKQEFINRGYRIEE